MKFGKALEMFNRLGSLSERYLDRDLVIEVYNPGSIGGTPCTKVAAIVQGNDWDGGKIILSPEQKLTSLTAEQVEAIMESARQGQSWHAYQSYKKQQDKIKALEAEVAALKASSPQPAVTQPESNLPKG
jgi:hypothetical protein